MDFFWKIIFPLTLSLLMGVIVVLYGLRTKKKFNEKNERYVDGLIPTHENFFIESNKQVFIWFVFAFICYLIAVWTILIFVKDPAIWLKNPIRVVGSFLIFPITGLAIWYYGWVISDAKKRNMDIKKYRYFNILINHLFIRKNYPIINGKGIQTKSFQRNFIIGLGIWLALILFLTFSLLLNIDKIK